MVNFISRPAAHQPGKGAGIYHSCGVVFSEIEKLKDNMVKMLKLGSEKNSDLAELLAKLSTGQQQTAKSTPNVAAEQAKTTAHTPGVG